ncbi:MAG TPA: PGPGW domain-containing protein [Candidatus Chromulinivoraceae bacterium]|nr:PGPGW domain-containing protein [Candidatus Chromulinivoraceae bacterium]
MEKIVTFLEARQTGYLRLPRFAQISITILSLVMGVVGLVVTFSPVSDLGILLLLASLSVLSLEFMWAKRTLHYMLKRISDKKFLKKFSLIVVPISLIILAVVWFLTHR